MNSLCRKDGKHINDTSQQPVDANRYHNNVIFWSGNSNYYMILK